MSELGKSKFLNKIIELTPILLLFIAVLNEFDFNYLNLQYFSFNFPFILIFYWSLKKPENLGYGLIFFAGLINDVVVGFPIGIIPIRWRTIAHYCITCIFKKLN